MRKAFLEALVDLAGSDPRVLLLTGDLGYTVVEPFAERFPDRFFNVGVAEQNLIGLATGLAGSGRIPFVYSIATFASLRPYEFLRNGPVHHELPVRIVAVGGGFDYGPAGPSHHAVEDLALMRALPGLDVVVPADARQAATALASTWRRPRPIYYRLARDDRGDVPGLDGRFEPGRAIRLTEGPDVVLVALGPAAHAATEAARLLAAEGIEAGVLVVSTLEPAPLDDLAAALAAVRAAVTIENHSIAGGLGSLACEVVAERRLGCLVRRQGVRHRPDGATGSAAWHERREGLDPPSIARAAREVIEEADR